MRISVEGWMLAPAEWEGPDRPPAPPAPALPSPPPPGGAGITGSLFVTGEDGKTFVGSGTAVRLLTDMGTIESATGSILQDCGRQRVALLAEAETLAGKAERSMRTIEDSSRAFDEYDEARRGRNRVIRDLRELDIECDQRVEAALEPFTAARGLTGTDGRFAILDAPPGTYLLYAWFDSELGRNLWAVSIDLTAGEELALDLTNQNRTSLTARPDYR